MLAIEPAELRMDKDLGVFEFISKQDFSTVNNKPSAAAAGNLPAIMNQPSNFDFENFDAEPKGGQNVEQFFDFN